jgi:hypothetical protein
VVAVVLFASAVFPAETEDVVREAELGVVVVSWDRFAGCAGVVANDCDGNTFGAKGGVVSANLRVGNARASASAEGGAD